MTTKLYYACDKVVHNVRHTMPTIYLRVYILTLSQHGFTTCRLRKHDVYTTLTSHRIVCLVSSIPVIILLVLGLAFFFFFFFNCLFYQLLCVQDSCFPTQYWGSVLPSIVETRDQNSQGCPLLLSNRNLGSFCV